MIHITVFKFQEDCITVLDEEIFIDSTSSINLPANLNLKLIAQYLPVLIIFKMTKIALSNI